MRLELSSGGWADIRERPENAQYVAIIEAAERASNGRGTWTAWAQEVGRQMAASGQVRVDGKLVDLEDAWDRADPDDTDAICQAGQTAWGAWQKQRRPKPRTATSSDDTPPESPST